MVEHTGDIVSHGGHDFPAAASGKIGKYEINDSAAHVGKSIAVEEKKRGAAMTLPQEFYGFVEGGDFDSAAAPLCFKRSIAL